ncbi:lipopolysaccharide heptosyltransferase I [Helicobacter bizzozeronii]|uniref:lipopolysaccharide heptosyltransferase I n=1 Tax=Helicobacter bizzozeronii TaxID=56877 RepID=UPI000CEDE5C6|nr:lipopolysaccharide heptosyltransferase I [Helicobacter bizzozeronii]
MNIAIIRLSALGDVVVSAVFLPFIKAHYPKAQIHWFIDEAFAPLLQNCPYIDVLHALPYKKTLRSKNPLAIGKFYRSLRHLGLFDLIIDMQGLLKSALIGLFLAKKSPKRFVGFDARSIKEPIASLFYTHKVAIPYQEHILKRNQRVLQEGLSVIYPPQTWEQTLNKRHLAFFCPPITQELGDKPCVLFVLESSKPTKTYPLDRFYELGLSLKDCNLSVAILWHAHPQNAHKLHQTLSPHLPTILLPRMDLEQVKTLVSLVSVVVGGDTGIVHLAWALKTPSVTLYGNTPPKRFSLEGERHISLCGNPQANYHKKDFSIQNILPRAIKEAILQVLERSSC